MGDEIEQDWKTEGTWGQSRDMEKQEAVTGREII